MAVDAGSQAGEANARQIVSEMFGFIESQGKGDYLGERVSQLQHSLQAATFAQKAGADDEMVLGALLHDVGRFIPAEKKATLGAPDGTNVGKASHEVVGEHYLSKQGFSYKICQLVGAHVFAKRYLCAIDASYQDGLSSASKSSFKHQGGAFSKEQVMAAQQDHLLEEKVAVRRWDDQAKDPLMQTPPLSSFEEMAVQSLLKSKSY
ncbi:Uu.00g009330.m01.CDS01 [Anthostomella pinea]|uniref:Uu.00g009330.m01.CDS01 n=1 Tax=Anthostomella pinea TaxID=933095 RepID=A0AAI8YPV3_9PEZI|nr:Uu.00g009330.m01.CDS01 [Anthostomella pinea]